MNGPSHLFLERGQNGHSSVKHKLALQPKTEKHPCLIILELAIYKIHCKIHVYFATYI